MRLTEIFIDCDRLQVMVLWEEFLLSTCSAINEIEMSQGLVLLSNLLFTNASTPYVECQTVLSCVTIADYWIWTT